MTDTTYTRTAKFLHWLIAAGIIFMLALGWCMDFFPRGETRFFAIQLHKSIGITILLLALIRLGWRLRHRPPALPASLAKWEKAAAHIGHFLLYCGMIGMPMTGWAMVSASPYDIPTLLYGVIPWPHLPILPTLENKEAYEDFFHDAHALIAYLLAAMIAIHALAALKHHFISNDDILLRIVPRCCAGFLNRLRDRRS